MTKLLGLLLLLAPTLLQAQVQARRANDFVETIGVNTHFGSTDTKYYTQYDSIKALLADLKVRHIREGMRVGWAHGETVRNRFQDLYSSLGITLLYISGQRTRSSSTPALNDILDTTLISRELTFLSPIAPAIYAIEGPNEYRKNSPTTTWPTILKNYQIQLYNKLKNHPTLSNVKRVGPSIINRDMPNALDMSEYCDYGNMHLYVDHPGGDAGGSVPMTYARMMQEYDRIYGVNKPGMITETGGHNAILPTGFRHNSYRVSAKIVPRQFTEYFYDNRDWPAVVHYELIDERLVDTLNQQHNFGLVYRNLKPKPAFITLKNLITLLDDKDATFTPASLNYTITGTDMSDVRHLLLQKGDGKFYLCTWLELPKSKSYNSSTGVELNPTRSLTLNFGSPIANMKRYEPCDPDNLYTGTVARQTYTNPSSSLDITVRDWVSVYEIELSQVKNFTLINAETQQPVADLIRFRIMLSLTLPNSVLRI